MESGTSPRERLTAIIAIVLSIFLVITLPISVIAHNGIRAIFSSQALKQGLSQALLLDGEMKERLVDQVYAAGWLDDVNQAGVSPFQYLTLQDRNRIADELFPGDWLRAQIEDAFASIMSWVHSDEPRPDFSLNVESIKEHLSDLSSTQITEVLVNSWPACTREEELITQRALSVDTSSEIIFCQPGSSLYPDLVDNLDARFQTYLRNIQSEIAILDGDEDTAPLSDLTQLKEQLLKISLWLRWLRLAPLPLLGMIMALRIRSFTSLSRWWGVPLWIGSALGLVFTLVIWWISPNLLSQVTADSGSSLTLKGVISAVLSDVLRGTAFHLMILFVIGALLTSLAWAISRRKDERKDPELARVAEKPKSWEVESDAEAGDSAKVVPSPPPVKPYHPGERTESGEEGPG